MTKKIQHLELELEKYSDTVGGVSILDHNSNWGRILSVDWNYSKSAYCALFDLEDG